MLRFLLFSLFALVAFNIMGQVSVSYEYDNAGNRVSRKTIGLTKSATVDTTEQVAPIEDQMNQLSVKIYPNPTKGMLKVDIEGGDEESDYSATIYDQNGRTIMVERRKGNGSLPLDLSGKSTGYYILIVDDGKNRLQYKIIKN